MQEVISTHSRADETLGASAISRMAARLSFSAAIAFLVLLAALHLIKPELDPSWHFISEYAIGKFGWIMQLTFLSLAVSFATIFVAVKPQIRTTGGKIGLVLALIVVAALVAGALFTIDPISTPQDQVTSHGNIHGLATMIGNPSSVLATLLISMSLIRNSAWHSVRRRILLIGNLPWISLLIMFAVMGVTLSQAGTFGPDVPVGWPNRLLVITYSVWLMTVAGHALQLNQRKP